MRKFLFLIFGLLVIVSSYSQNGTTHIGKDEFTYKKIQINEKEKGNIPFSDAAKYLINKASENTANSNRSDIGIGETKGELSVSLTGGASYDIPISVPQGINGIVPQLSLNYNSQAGDGLAGYGWNLSGVSVISRVPSTKFHDGQIDPVDFDNLDRFALDGKRLILMSGIYGANEARYQTENFSNLRIISYGTSVYGASYGPSYFIVYYPDGSLAHYGNSTDSRSRTNFAITYWQNAQGVRINYEYTTVNNTLSISKIKYGHINTSTPINEVRFEYNGALIRGDRAQQAYINNILFERSNVLTRIRVYSNGTQYRYYNLSHDNSDLGYPRLTSVTEYSGDGALNHSPINFEYTTSSSSVNYTGLNTSLTLTNIEQRNAETVPLDLTGNGSMDFIVYPKPEKNKFWVFKDLQSGVTNDPYLVNTGDFEALFPVNWINYANKIMPGHGISVVQNGTNNAVNFLIYSNSITLPLYYQYTKTWTAPTYSGQTIPKQYLSGDFNGDGLTDIVAIPKETAYNYKGVYLINLKQDISSGFVNYAGVLTQNVIDEDQFKTADVNGDGKTDILHFSGSGLRVYTFNASNALTLLWTQPYSPYFDSEKPIYLGDYNGDGKTDFLLPNGDGSNSFANFTSTGTTFRVGIVTQPFSYNDYDASSSGGFVKLSGYNLIPLDINGDGRTDILEYNTVTYNDHPLGFTPPDGTQTLKIYNNTGYYDNPFSAKFTYGGMATKTGNVAHFPIPIFLTSDQPNKKLEFASISDQWITSFSFTQDHREDVLLRSISNNGVTQTIAYNSLDPTEQGLNYTPVYQITNGEVYPYGNLDVSPQTKVVTSLQRIVAGAITLTQQYSYYGAVYNVEGLGFLGFKGVTMSNWHTDNSDRIYSTSRYDPLLRGALIEEYSQANYFQFSPSPSYYITKTSNTNSSYLLPNKVFKLWVDSSLTQNSIEGTYTLTSYQYDSSLNPTQINTNYSGNGSSVTNTSYGNNFGTNYYVGRVLNETTTNYIGSESFSTEMEFIYNGFLITQKKTKGNGTPFDVEDYEYDTFGNITKKTVTPYNTTSREILFEYDTTGRFLEKSTDVEGLETAFTYNPNNGNLMSETNPYQQTTNYDYDSWNRLVLVTDYLGNDVTTSYVESANVYTITETGDDGSGSIAVYDALKRLIKVQEKNVMGQWVSVNYQYDKFDRVWKESEPFLSGSSPSQWSETTYDFYGRPITQALYNGKTINISYSGLTTTVNDGTKTVTTIKNALGNITSVTDPGGTINYSYYGNGNLKNADYNGVIVTTEQDGWGRKTKTIDPSAGEYKYDYNGFGEIISELSPKGETIFTYSSTGKILTKKVVGDNTDMYIEYSYDPNTKFLNQIIQTDSQGDNAEYYYSYDNQNRLTDISEGNTHAKFSKTITYDSFNRIATEEYFAKYLGNGKTSQKKVKNNYQYGQLKSIQDFSTNEYLWNINALNTRGQVVISTMGNNLRQINLYDTYGYTTGIVAQKNITTSSQDIMQLTFDFDPQRGILNSRTNSMFSWSETFEYDNLDRLLDFDDNDGNNNHVYDTRGRITTNSSIGDYSYTGNSYQLTDVDLNNQGDLYYQQNQLQQVTYNAFKKPVKISEIGKEKIDFQYNAFMGRSHMFYGGTANDMNERNHFKHYSYDGSMEIKYDKLTDTTTFVTYIGGDAYSAPAIWKSEQGNTTVNDYYYLYRDYLGSVMMISDGEGNIKEKRHFDAWGNIVKLTDGNNVALEKLTFLDRGYTGHEHLHGVNLVHMNGRLYDPKLRRFLEPDNYIQDLTNTQNFNRYGYVLNNPLMYVDPSGEFLEWAVVWLVVKIVAAVTVATLGVLDIVNNRVSSSSGSDPNSAGPSNSNNSQEIASGINNIPGSGYRLDYNYEYKFGIEEIATSPSISAMNPLAALNHAALFGSTPNGNNLNNSETGFNITGEDVLDTALDFVPLVGGAKDIYKGIQSGDGWQVALGVGSIVADVFTLGTASIAKGAIKTGIKVGTRAIVTKQSKMLLKKAVKNPQLTIKESAAAIRNPNLAPMMNGKGIDRAFRNLAKNNFVMKNAQKYGLIKINSTTRGADIVGKGFLTGAWWDITTPGAWAQHVKKYGEGGIKLLY